MPPERVPPGWTADTRHDYKPTATAHARYGLVGAVTPLLRFPQDMTMLFACGGAYYLVDEISDDVCRIVQPADLPGILAALVEPLDSAPLRLQELDELPKEERSWRYDQYLREQIPGLLNV